MCALFRWLLTRTPSSSWAEAANAYTGDYPLARFLYLYVNHKPGDSLDPLRREFVRYLFSTQGQEDVVKDGYFPITLEIAIEAYESLGLDVDALAAGAGLIGN